MKWGLFNLVLFFWVAVLLLVALTGCAPFNGPGVVTEKDHDSTWTQITCSTINKVTTCTPIIHPEQWELRVRDREGKHHWVSVGLQEWDHVEVGDKWTR